MSRAQPAAPKLGLSGRMLSGPALFGFAVTASSPMTVLAGGIIATYAATGVTGVPLSFVLIGAALLLLSVGYVAMARHLPHAATAYALIAHGLGPASATAAGWLALLSYNAIQVSLYGLLGATMAHLWGGQWAMWAAVALAAVAVLGVARVRLSARLLVLTLTAEVAVIAVIDVLGFTHPAGGHVGLGPLNPHHLFVNGVGGVFALSIAAFIGYESGPVFAEEARGARTVARATITALVFLSAFYAISAWALAAATGEASIVDASRDPGGGLPFSILAAQYGHPIVNLATVLLISSVFASMLSFHNTVARYVFALARERVLPAGLASIGRGRGAGAPIGGSVAQTLVAAVIVAGFAMADADPITTLFTWLSTVAAVGILALLILCSVAALRYFHHGGGSNESWAVRVAAPGLGALAGIGVLGLTVANVDSLLGVAPGSPLTVLVPGLGLATLAGGGLHGLWLRRHRPHVFAGIGRGRPHPLALPETRMADLVV